MYVSGRVIIGGNGLLSRMILNDKVKLMLMMELGTCNTLWYLHHNQILLPWPLVIDWPTYRVEQGLPPYGDVEGDVEVGLVAARVELHIPSHILLCTSIHSVESHTRYFSQLPTILIWTDQTRWLVWDIWQRRNTLYWTIISSQPLPW